VVALHVETLDVLFMSMLFSKLIDILLIISCDNHKLSISDVIISFSSIF
jgi:hypothetical protein